MTIANNFIDELKRESAVTRKLLERIPEEKFSWKPHDKSMTMGRLASHIAEMIGWVKKILTKNELNLDANRYMPFEPKSNKELLEFFDKNLDSAVESLSEATDQEITKQWTLKRADKVLLSMPRDQVLRSIILNHIIHHRGQLSVYLRLNDIPVPSIYGPSADET